MKKFVTGLSKFGLSVFSISTFLSIVGLAYLNSQLPSVNKIRDSRLSQPLRIYDSKGVLLSAIGDEISIPISRRDIPDSLIRGLNLVTGTEVGEHANHFVTAFFSSKQDKLGTSLETKGYNLSQLLADNYLQQQYSQSFRRTSSRLLLDGEEASSPSLEEYYQEFLAKLRLALLSYKIDVNLSPDEILTLVINKLTMGNNSYGFEAAAQIYFGANLNSLSVSQLAFLIAVSENPEKLDPNKNLDSVVERRNLVLKELLKIGFLSEANYKEAVAEVVELRSSFAEDPNSYLSQIVSKAMEKRFQQSAYKQGFDVYLTIDKKDQDLAQLYLNSSLLRQETGAKYRGVKAVLWKPGSVPFSEAKIVQLLKKEPAFAPMFPVVITKVTADSLDVIDKFGSKKTLSRDNLALALNSGYTRPELTKAQSKEREFEGVLPGQGSLKDSSKFLLDSVAEENKTESPPAEAKQDLNIALSKVFAPGEMIYLAIKESAEQFQTAALMSSVYSKFDPLAEVNVKDLYLAQIPQSSGAMVSLDSTNGAIQTLVGGFSYQIDNKDYALNSTQNIGGLVKPFIYALGLVQNQTLATLQGDVKTELTDTEGNLLFSVQNYDNKLSGKGVSLRTALGQNLNTVAMRVAAQVGANNLGNFLGHFGLPVKEEDFTYRTLGLGEFNVSPIEVARAYAVINNGGYLINPYLITRVIDARYHLSYEANPVSVCEQCEVENVFAKQERAQNDVSQIGQLSIIHEALSSTIYDLDQYALDQQRIAPRVLNKEVAYLINDALQTNIQGRKDFTGHANSLAAVGKEYKRSDLGAMFGLDEKRTTAWFAGFSANYTGAIYTQLKNTSLPPTQYMEANARPWLNFNYSFLENIQHYELARPDGVVAVKINPLTGRADNRGTLSELFRKVNAPQVVVEEKPKYIYVEREVTVRKTVQKPVTKKKQVDPKYAKQYDANGNYIVDEFGFYDDD